MPSKKKVAKTLGLKNPGSKSGNWEKELRKAWDASAKKSGDAKRPKPDSKKSESGKSSRSSDNGSSSTNLVVAGAYAAAMVSASFSSDF